MKNIEKIRNMSAEELTEFLENSRCCCAYNDTDRGDNRSCEQGIAEWLEQEAEKPSIFEPRKGDVYYYINDGERVFDSVYAEDAIDMERKAFGNACTDKSVMERKAHDLKLWSLLWNFAEENNDEMDWKDDKERKYYIYKNHCAGSWMLASDTCCENIENIMPYFSSAKLARRAIEEIVIPWERGEL